MPTRRERGHWLPAPNGIHFHSPTVLYVDADQEQSAGDVVTLMVRHDLDDTDAVLAAAELVGDEEYRRERMPGHQVLPWAGDEATLADVLRHLALDKLPWLAMTRDVERRGGWGDRVIDALCDPPETFLLSLDPRPRSYVLGAPSSDRSLDVDAVRH